MWLLVNRYLCRLPTQTNKFEPGGFRTHYLYIFSKSMTLSWCCFKLSLFIHLSHINRVFISSDFVTGAIRFQDPFYLFVNIKSTTFILSGYVEIYLVFLWKLNVGAKAVHARSISFQALPFGLINIVFDYFLLVIITYSEIHLMLSTVLQWTNKTLSFSLLSLVWMFFFMMFITPLKIPLTFILLPCWT